MSLGRVVQRGLKCVRTFVWLLAVLLLLLLRAVRAATQRLFTRHSSSLPHFYAETRYLRQNVKCPAHLAVCLVPESTKLTSVFKSLFAYCVNVLRTNITTEEQASRRSFEGVGDNTSSDAFVDIQSIARLIGWAWIANISVISLYDYNGKLKLVSERLRKAVVAELETVLWVTENGACKIPHVKIHYEAKDKPKNGYTNGVNGYAKDQTLHIYLYSNEDGKGGLVKAAKELVVERIHSKDISKDGEIKEKDVNAKYDEVLGLKKETLPGTKTEPDLLVILGNVTSTLGFLPWQIRLTEIHWLPSPKHLEIADFLRSLRVYGGCQQRFGT